jgi:hypothetical protein
VIGRRNEDHAVAVGDLMRQCDPLLVVRPDEDDLGTVRADPVNLDPGRVVRHDDEHSDAQQTARAGERLGVVAARMSHHTARVFLVFELRQRVERAANFERAGRLEALGLQETAFSEGQQRRPDDPALDPIRRCPDLVNGHKVAVIGVGHVAILRPRIVRCLQGRSCRVGGSDRP